MKIYSLTSGSKGNATLIECGDFNILIDAGSTKRYLVATLNKINKQLSDIDMVLITHFHRDHCKCLNCFSENIIYSNRPEHQHLSCNEENNISGISIKPFELSHDEGCFGYQIKYDKETYLHISDTGYLKNEYLPLVQECDYLYLEFNHDAVMLRETRRPQQVKKRILSDKGHLNNQAAAYVLANTNGRLKQVIVAHISEEANSIPAIKQEIKNVFAEYNKKLTFELKFSGYQQLVIGGSHED